MKLNSYIYIYLIFYIRAVKLAAREPHVVLSSTRFFVEGPPLNSFEGISGTWDVK